MKTISYLLVSALVASNYLTAVAAEPPAKASGKRIAMVRVGDVGRKLFDRVAKHVEQNAAVPVRILPPRASKETKLEKLEEALAKLKEADDVCLLAVAAVPTNVVLHGFVYDKNGVGIVNVTLLAAGKPGGPDAAEQFNRRVEAEVLCVLGLVLGLKPCPFPRCCMFTDVADPAYNEKARDYCPPCHGKLENLLTQRGVKFEGQGKPESP